MSSLLNGYTIRCGYGSQISKYGQCIFLEVDQSFHEAFWWIHSFTWRCPAMEITFRSEHSADILCIFHNFHFAKLVTICGHPIQHFTATFAAILYPREFPMIEVEPSHTILNHKGRRQGGHNNRKDEAATAKSSASERVEESGAAGFLGMIVSARKEGRKPLQR